MILICIGKMISSRSKLGLLMILLAANFSPLVAQQVGSTASLDNYSEYYPLAPGNTWNYRVFQRGKKTTKRVTWRVERATWKHGNNIFVLRPTPMNADDEVMQLQITPEGLKEVTDDFYLIKFPVQSGTKWTAEELGREFKMLGLRETCEVGRFHFTDCLVVVDDDQQLGLRTVTTYARKVGPVKYEYYSLKQPSGADLPPQTLTLVSYSLSSKRSR
jgi:hypothetical protein